MKVNITSDQQLELVPQTPDEAALLQRLSGDLFVVEFRHDTAIVRRADRLHTFDEYDNNA